MKMIKNLETAITDITNDDTDTQEFDAEAFLANHRAFRLSRRQFTNHPPRLDKDETSTDRRLSKRATLP